MTTTEKINNCNTVEEVERLRCHECANSGHWGWCNVSHIKCDYKNRIKEILGENESRYTTEEHISMILDK